MPSKHTSTDEKLEKILEKVFTDMGVVMRSVPANIELLDKLEEVGENQLRPLLEAYIKTNFHPQKDSILKADVVEAIPARKEKSSKGYPNAEKLEAWKDGYNKCRTDVRESLNLEGQK